jgi:hypothetical protein
VSCENQEEKIQFQPGVEYKARMHINAFEAKSEDVCFTFSLPVQIQRNVLDFSAIHNPVPCYEELKIDKPLTIG